MAVMEVAEGRHRNVSNSSITREEADATPSFAVYDQLQDFHSLHGAIKELCFGEPLIFT